MLIGVILSCGSTWDYEIWSTDEITPEDFDLLLEREDWNSIYNNYITGYTRVTQVYIHPLNDVDVIFFI